MYQSSIDIIPNFDMRANTHAQQFNKKQFRVVLSWNMQRFNPGNDRHADFALTKVHSTVVCYCAQLHIKMEETCSFGNL